MSEHVNYMWNILEGDGHGRGGGLRPAARWRTAEATLAALRALVRGRTSDGPRTDLGAFPGKYGKMVG